MAYTNPSEINWSIGIQEVFNYVDILSEGWFSIFLLIAIFIIVLMGIARTKDFFEAASISGFVTFLVALGFFFAGIINLNVLIFIIGIAVISVGLLWLVTKKS